MKCTDLKGNIKYLIILVANIRVVVIMGKYNSVEIQQPIAKLKPEFISLSLLPINNVCITMVMSHFSVKARKEFCISYQEVDC